MNPNRIEAISVREISNVVDDHESMRRFIEINDKTPIWDGEIWLYDNVNQSNKSLNGRIPIQIKGTVVDEFSEGKRQYRLDKSHLKAYLKDRGIIFLVVEIINSKETKIFFKVLLPLDIRDILKRMGANETIQETFIELPQREFEIICRDFLIHSDKQKINISHETLKFDNYIGFITGYKDPSKNKHLFDTGTYLYGRESTLKIDVPLYKINIVSILEQDSLDIGTKNQVYYKKIIRETTKQGKVAKFGKGFSLKLSQNNTMDIKFKETGSIKDRIYDCKFMLEMLKNRNIYINQHKIDYTFPESKFTKMLLNMPKKIEFMENALETFNLLNIDINNEYDLVIKEIEKVAMLIDIILKVKYDDIIVTDKNYQVVTVGKYSILLLQIFSKENQNQLIDYFNYNELKEKYRILAGRDELFEESVEHSPYIMVRLDDLLGYDNLNITSIEKSLANVNYNYPLSSELTNNFLLDILSYCDDNDKSTNNKLLAMVCNVYRVLEEKTDNDVTYFINRMQSLKRMRDFNQHEIERMIECKDRHLDNESILCAFLILLDNKHEFTVRLKKMDGNVRKSIVDYPIYNLISK